MAIVRITDKSPNLFLEKSPLLQLWVLRLLVPLEGHKDFVSSFGFSNDHVAKVLGLGKWIDPAQFEFDPKKVRRTLRSLHQTGEQKYFNAPVPTTLSKNIERLAEMVGLTSTDCRILEFAVLIDSERLLDDVADCIGEISTATVFYVLSVLLSVPESEVRASFSSQGALAKSGLLTLDRNGRNSLRRKLNLLSTYFADCVFTDEVLPLDLLRDMVAPCTGANLAIDDYDHINSDLSILRPYLKKSIENGRKGVNIFLYGPPGTGKSQLAKVLARELRCELFEVTSEDLDGDPITGERRLRAYRAAQCFFANGRSLILFDEVEDVFDNGNGFFGHKSTAQTHKAWINRTLEENPIPTLWLSNSIKGLDPAFIRRFDMVFELPMPPKKQRERILQKSCGELLDPTNIDRIAETENLAPAVIVKTSSVISSIKNELQGVGVGHAYEQLINNTLQAQGHKPIKKYDPNRLPEFYDPAFINADTNVGAVATGLIAAKSGRLCLYGPSGTGKTAYGRWIANQLGVPLLTKRASDLMSMWVGENEKNIAKAFHEAEQEGALLLIDEVDSFLQDRRGAQQSWQINLVNEMLTQMESFSGVFIASTNLMDGLDQAALRRFDLKIKFDFLLVDQAWQLLIEHCKKLQLLPPSQELRARVNCMHKLTPGDFAAVLRQHRFRSIETSAMFVAALEAECAIKEGVKRPMGFIH